MAVKVDKIKAQEIDKLAPLHETYKESEEFVALMKAAEDAKDEDDDDTKRDMDPQGY